MNPDTELATLKQEVARLRQEMNELKQFIQYQPPGTGDDDKPEAACLIIRCAFLQLAHPSDPSNSQLNLFSSREGPCITLLGPAGSGRLTLQVDPSGPELGVFGADKQYAACVRLEDGNPELDLYAAGGKLGVQLKVETESGRGQVGVCEAGRPRAIMQATPTGAAISAVHDDGHSRITLISSVNNGELLAVTPDMKVGVKIAADGLDGGYITVNRANGKAGVILSNTPIGGAVIVQDHGGHVTGHLPALPAE